MTKHPDVTELRTAYERITAFQDQMRTMRGRSQCEATNTAKQRTQSARPRLQSPFDAVERPLDSRCASPDRWPQWQGNASQVGPIIEQGIEHTQSIATPGWHVPISGYDPRFWFSLQPASAAGMVNAQPQPQQHVTEEGSAKSQLPKSGSNSVPNPSKTAHNKSKRAQKDRKAKETGVPTRSERRASEHAGSGV